MDIHIQDLIKKITIEYAYCMVTIEADIHMHKDIHMI